MAVFFVPIWQALECQNHFPDARKTIYNRQKTPARNWFIQCARFAFKGGGGVRGGGNPRPVVFWLHYQ
jgi:hypothetical protein